MIYHQLDGKGFQVWHRKFAEESPKQLTDGPESHGYAAIAPGGKMLAYQSVGDSRTALFVMPVDGGKVEWEWRKPGNWFMGNWTPDGRNLVVATNSGSGWRIVQIPVGGTEMKPMMDELPLRSYVRYPRMSPDGKRVAYEFNESKGNVFLAELERRR